MNEEPYSYDCEYKDEGHVDSSGEDDILVVLLKD